ncbi:hypothetical protein [Daejeonella sp.]|uniref:hypothetical protein n=1 Tax=Daejeonella sp. TaxID=2805397 RepID=UPI0039839AA0
MKYVFLLLFSAHAVANGQNPGPRLAAMGSGGTAVSDIWSLQQNPAGIAELRKPKMAVAFERRFLDAEVSTQNAVFAFPFRNNVLGVSLERYGFSEFNEQKVGLCYAKRFGNTFSMAIGLKYYLLNITEYGSAKAFTVEVGFQLKVTDDFTIASHIANPNQSQYNNLKTSILPAKLSFGGSFKVSDRLLMTADIMKLLKYPPDFMTGIEYNIIPWFSLRGGVSVNPFKQYAGFGISYNKMQVDISVASHPSLGYSPQIGLGYEF